MATLPEQSQCSILTTKCGQNFMLNAVVVVWSFIDQQQIEGTPEVTVLYEVEIQYPPQGFFG